ncbi:OmpA family protein [Pseudoduganella sp. GCM10020061]|uniref:OmpA family protein n=1 Tax=Pseudoduganella sp. GCM10020061 TaxID=3317345 RepID=UPI00363B6E9C
MNTTFFKSAAIALAFALAGCSSTPLTTPTLDEARAAYRDINSDPKVASLAPLEFRQASEALERANSAAAKRENLEEVDKLAYLAKQRIETAREVARAKSAEEQAQAAARERDQVRLDARTAEAEKAKADAERARAEAAAAQSQTEEARRQAAAAEQAARDAQARIAQFEAVLIELQAKKTERGMVVTIGDVLFDVDQARLKPQGMDNVRKLAEVLKTNPERTVMVEGFTDSTGSDAYNQQLSERRATAVRDALVSQGVERARIQMRGYGERFPVASNNTAADRQLNRRVEIVLSDESGRIPPR